MCGGNSPSKATYSTPRCLRPVEKEKASHGDLVVEEFPVSFDGYTYRHGRIAYIKGAAPRPVVLVHHNYAGLKQFDIDQACFIAKVGYVGLAVDLYQETDTYTYRDRGVTFGRPVTFDEYCEIAWAENIMGLPDPRQIPKEMLKGHWDATPKDADGKVDWQGTRHFIGAFSTMRRLLCEPQRWRGLMQAYLDLAFKHPAVKHGLAAAIGYCLGGQSCLEQLRAGQPVQAISSFHGLLHSRPTTEEEPFNSLRRMPKEEYQSKIAVPNVYTSGCRVLIENGEHDHEVPADTIEDFTAEMNAQEIDWRFVQHARGPHGFALPPGCPGGDHYVEAIDRRSTLDMLGLFAEIWPDFPQFSVECNAAGAKLATQSQQGTFRLGLLVGALGGVLATLALRRSRM